MLKPNIKSPSKYISLMDTCSKGMGTHMLDPQVVLTQTNGHSPLSGMLGKKCNSAKWNGSANFLDHNEVRSIGWPNGYSCGYFGKNSNYNNGEDSIPL